MSTVNKFLGTSTNDVTDGSLSIYGLKVGAKNLINNETNTIKVNQSGFLYAAPLTANDYPEAISNPIQEDIDVSEYRLVNIQESTYNNGSNTVDVNFNSGIQNQILDLQEVIDTIDNTSNVTSIGQQTNVNGDLMVQDDLQIGGSIIGDLTINDVHFTTTQTNQLGVIDENVALVVKADNETTDGTGIMISGNNSGVARSLDASTLGSLNVSLKEIGGSIVQRGIGDSNGVTQRVTIASDDPNSLATSSNTLAISDKLPASLGSKIEDESLSVTLASNQSAINVTTNNQICARAGQFPGLLGKTTTAQSLCVTMSSDESVKTVTMESEVLDSNHTVKHLTVGGLNVTTQNPETLTTNGGFLRVYDPNLINRIPLSLGSKTTAESLTVTMANDEPIKTVTNLSNNVGAVLNTTHTTIGAIDQFGAHSTLLVDVNRHLYVSDNNINNKLPTKGQKAASGCVPVVMSADYSSTTKSEIVKGSNVLSESNRLPVELAKQSYQLPMQLENQRPEVEQPEIITNTCIKTYSPHYIVEDLVLSENGAELDYDANSNWSVTPAVFSVLFDEGNEQQFMSEIKITYYDDAKNDVDIEHYATLNAPLPNGYNFEILTNTVGTVTVPAFTNIPIRSNFDLLCLSENYDHSAVEGWGRFISKFEPPIPLIRDINAPSSGFMVTLTDDFSNLTHHKFTIKVIRQKTIL